MFLRFCRGVAGIAASAFLFAAPVQAGTKVLMNFANLSPYTAKIEFPKWRKECWNNTGAEYDRDSWWNAHTDGRVLLVYERNFKEGFTWYSSHKPYLQHFRGAYGVSDFADLPTWSMDDTTAVLGPGQSGERPDMALFRGEVSAAAHCAYQEASRGFTLTLLDAQGEVKSRYDYEMLGSRDGQWQLSRKSPHGDAAAQHIVLGTGRHGLATIVAFAAPGVLATSASPAARQAEALSVRAAARAPGAETSWGVHSGHSPAAAHVPFAKTFVLAGRMSATRRLNRESSLGEEVAKRPEGSPVSLSEPPAGPVELVRRPELIGTPMPFFMAGLFDGLLYYARPDSSGSQENTVVAMSTEALLRQTAEPGFDYDDPILTLVGGMPETISKRNICLIEGARTLFGARMCSAVGISLDILPNGSLVASPLPNVGDGSLIVRH